ncbi:type II CRISPR RNA-guided endonuclease Cas9 [Sandaracinobacter sp. RS1-74]|nr:type II CRISPR RNA-guided endonuclease Cas9 [Sandaracinobacteroides sayramensis]MCG2840651.1 type II CRISPR RNA-guided endonuclease Cas9 [Sandaracinobacteroides sayramensis]
MQRQRALMKYLVADGLFPADEAERKALNTLDPFALRARALDEALPLPHLGRAVWHLNQRRGFKSNRKADRPDDDSGKIAVGVDRLVAAIADSGARTFGEWLHGRRQGTEEYPEGLSVRTRLRPEEGAVAKGMGYDFYPGRALIEEEFDAIWAAQAPHHPEVLTPEVHDRLFEILFHQRPLKTPQIGTCTFGNGETRLAKAHPLFQRRRLLEEVNALRIVRAGKVAERLTPEQRDLLVLKLKDKAEVSFETLRKTLRLDEDARFNKESENRTKLKGDEVAAVMGGKTRFGTRWAHLSFEAQYAIVERLEAAESDADVAAFRDWVAEAHDLPPEATKAIAAARLPQGHGRFGESVTRGLIDALTHERDGDGRVVVYSEAVERLGLHHSDFRTGEIRQSLPYYGAVLDRHVMPGSGNPDHPEEKRLGKLTNPTVHIGLNQLRRTVNRLIERFGPPAEIAIELARELKLTDEEKKRHNRENNENRLAAEKRSAKLAEIGQPDTGANRALLKLWEELNPGNCLDRRCIYSGEQISIDMLFRPGAVEIDHILPFTATLDDSNGNKLVCIAQANRFKRKRSPWEAWGGTAQWAEIAERASRLPRGKRWRFEPDSMARFSADGGFLARQLVDTQYLSRLARDYLSSLYPETGEGSGKVWVSPGRLTEMVRRKLGLNDLLPDHNYAGGDQPKNRLDHRHHAIDAIVVAIVDRGMLNAIARASGLEGQEGRERIHIPAPWDGFRDEVAEVVRGIVVSHRPDHGTAGHGNGSTAGRLHNDTAYGLTGETDAKGNSIVVRRKPLGSLKPADVAAIRDPDLRVALHGATAGLADKAFEQALVRFSRTGPLQFRGIRRVRLTEPLTVIPIRDATGRAYKGYKGDSNYRYDVWELPDGKWLSDVVSMFDAHQPGERPRPHPAARRVLSLHQDDIIAIEPDGGERRLMRVVKFGQSGQVTLAAPNEAGDLKRRDSASNDQDPFKYIAPTAGGLKRARARKVGVDEIGRVRDPGFPARTARRATRRKRVE